MTNFAYFVHVDVHLIHTHTHTHTCMHTNTHTQTHTHTCMHTHTHTHTHTYTHMYAHIHTHTHTHTHFIPFQVAGTPLGSTSGFPLHTYPTPSSTAKQQQPDRCFGCSSASTEHCITMLKALSFKPQTRKLLVKQNIIRELMEFNLRSGGPAMQRNIRKLLCQITRFGLLLAKEIYLMKVVVHCGSGSKVTPFQYISI